MRSIITTGRCSSRKSLTDALRMLRDEGPLTPLAGCTDLYVSLNFGTLKDTRFLNLWRLDGLRAIGVRGDALSIGALATHTDLIRSPLVRKRLPMLAAAAREIGGVQIQNRGTIGGNVANASPAGDTLPVLAAADAIVVLKSAAATRRVPFTGFYTGYRQTVRRAGRADRRVRDSRRSRPAVVPQGRHARGAGDLEGRDGWSGSIAGPCPAPDRVRQRRADRDPARRERKRPSLRAARSTTRSGRWWTRSRRSTTSARRPTIDAASPRICSRVS